MPRVQCANAPSKPVLIYDGDCGFCRRWIAIWERATGPRVRYVASQDPAVQAEFPELSAEDFARAVQFVDTDGRVFEGAEAVFRSLAATPGHGIWLGCYRRIPIFARSAETLYRFVAAHRTGFSRLSALLIGRQPAEYRLLLPLLFRLLGLIYLIAFSSFWVQVDGLIGSNGLLPVSPYMDAAEGSLAGWSKFRQLPTLCWISSRDGFLHFQCLAGVALSLSLMAGLIPGAASLLLWVLYLSLTVAGRSFMSFQWENLLLECGFIALLFSPWRWRWRLGTKAPSMLTIWLWRWLLFRLMLESGVVKLASGDNTWVNLRALDYHYETQPLPTWIGWHAHQLPDWFHTCSVAVMFFIELILPWLALLNRQARLTAFWPLIFLQGAIALTGNYCYFNLLTVLLCLALLDDQAILRVKWLRSLGSPPETPPRAYKWPIRLMGRVVRATAVLTILLISAGQLSRILFEKFPGFVRPIYGYVGPFRSVNEYGLFAVMTTNRMEIIIEGSRDREHWLPYEFKFKPGDLKEAPRFVAPHQPRLDWQMWFAALSSPQQNPWLLNLCVWLLQGNPQTLALLETNPFPNEPPRWIRVRYYQYHFTDRATRSKTGEWWRREDKGLYLPPINLDMVRKAPR